jgi:hypothetical protein
LVVSGKSRSPRPQVRFMTHEQQRGGLRDDSV